MFEPNNSLFHHWLLFYRCVMFQKQYLEQTKWGAQAAVRGAGPPGPPPPPPPPPPPVATALGVTLYNV